MKRKLLSILTALALVLSLCPTWAFAAESGACGDNLTWTLSDDGILTISGIGAMEDYTSSNNSPWYGNKASIQKVVIVNGVTSIGTDAFSGCKQLTSVELPESVTSIGKRAFTECEALSSVTLPSGLTSISQSAFSYCKALTSIEIPSGVKSIGDYAFSASSLTEVKIPNGVISIGMWAFSVCNNLTKVEIPASVTSIGRSAFSSTSAEIHYAGTLAQWNSISGSENCGVSDGQLVINPHEVTITGGGADATGAGTYSEGATVEVSAGTKDGQLFAGWTASVELENFNAAQAETSFTMPANDVTLTANWAEAVVKVTANGGDTYYATIKDAWDKACAASSATITLLGNVESSGALFMGRGDTINLEGNGHTIIISDSSNAVYIDEGSTFTVTDCTISTTHENGIGLYINDGTVTVNNCTISGKYVGLWWQGDGSVTLNGGTFTSENDDAIRIWNNTPIPISTLLGEVDGKPCAYYDGNGKPVPLTEAEMEGLG